MARNRSEKWTPEQLELLQFAVKVDDWVFNGGGGYLMSDAYNDLSGKALSQCPYGPTWTAVMKGILMQYKVDLATARAVVSSSSRAAG